MDLQTMAPMGSAAIAIGGPAVAVAGGISLLFLKSFLSQQPGNPNHLPSVPGNPSPPFLPSFYFMSIFLCEDDECN